MKFKLRDYQQAAVDAAMEHMRKSTEPVLLELATGAGKALLSAELAKILHGLSKKRILCLQPSAELTQQNYEKFIANGGQASIYSASISKSLRHYVVYATPLTFINAPVSVKKQFSAVILDEAHGITSTIQAIIEELRSYNENLRVCGMSATPFRLGEGYIYKIDHKDKVANPNGYFTKLVYRVTARYLIDQGYLTPPIIGAIEAESYDVSQLVKNSKGLYTKESEELVYVGHGRKTAVIIADIVNQSRNRRGVMIFAATIQHANEVMASLPQGLAQMITGKTKKAERKRIIDDFKAQKFKYIVNVAVLTTGFDAPHVDVVAILRKTESAALYQQIIGRGMRLFDGKDDFLILDYAENVESLFTDGDVLDVKIDNYIKKESKGMEVACPDCGTVNNFGARPNEGAHGINEYGYFCDLDGNAINCEFGPIPAHYGRRCGGINMRTGDRCGYFWTCKECPECGHKNDISARYCTECRGEIINPNDKLTIAFKARKRDPSMMQTDRLIDVVVVRGVSQNGNDTYRASFVTDQRSFTVWFLIDHDNFQFARKTAMFELYIQNRPKSEWPKTISYCKKGNFWELLGFNNVTDEENLNNEIERNNQAARGFDV